MDIDFDLANGEIRRDGSRLELPPRALELLNLLVARAGEVVSRNEIRRALWKEGVHVDFDRSVNILVNQIRKGLHDDAKSPRFLETVPRHGYRFIATIERASSPRAVVLVLPFESMDDAKEQLDFARGLTEELIVELGRLSPADLVVIARTTALRYRGSDRDLRRIAEEHAVDYAVEGTVRWTGTRARIGAHLIDPRSQTQLWADTFEEEHSDVLSMQSQMARAITKGMAGHVLPVPADRSASGLAPSQRNRADSIAVLPFLNLREDEELDYFCEGVADGILNALARIPGVRVASRTSSFRFKGSAMDVREIGRSLEVETILEGSMRRVGKDLWVIAQLVNAREGYCVWSERYEKGDEEVFAIQDDIAGNVVKALRHRDSRIPEVRRWGTDKPAAYHMYLRGKYAWYQRYAGGIERAIECFQRAVQVDPACTPAHAGLSDCYAILGVYGFLPPELARSQAIAAAEHALENDPEHPVALASRAALHFYYEWNWSTAEKTFRRAVELEPTYLELRTTHTLFLSFTKQRDAAMASIRGARGIDPLSPYASSIAAFNHLMWGETELAKVECDRALAVEPDFLLALHFKAAALSRTGELAQAIDLLRLLAERTNRSAYALSWLAYAHAMAGERGEAERTREEILERLASTYVPPLFLAWIDAALGDAESARRKLERAIEEHHPMLIHFTLPVFDPLLADPTAKAMLVRHFPA